MIFYLRTPLPLAILMYYSSGIMAWTLFALSYFDDVISDSRAELDYNFSALGNAFGFDQMSEVVKTI